MSDLAIERPVRAERSHHGFVYLLDGAGTRIATVYGSGPARTARALAIVAALNGTDAPPAPLGQEPPTEDATAPTKDELAAEILARFQREPGAWHVDGRVIRGLAMRNLWERLDWSLARLDWGPSPAGNPGPYWHVPVREPADEVTLDHGWDGTVHRLYPRGKLAVQARQLRIAELQQGREGGTSFSPGGER